VACVRYSADVPEGEGGLVEDEVPVGSVDVGVSVGVDVLVEVPVGGELSVGGVVSVSVGLVECPPPPPWLT
jgi:hypothetical protein